MERIYKEKPKPCPAKTVNVKTAHATNLALLIIVSVNALVNLAKTVVKIMAKVKTFEEYFPKWMGDSTEDRKKAQMKKQAKMSDDDPEAYKELPGDTKGKKNTKTSVHTNRYHEKFGKKNEEAEGGMYMASLEKIIKDTQEVLGMISPEMDLPAWVQDKITIAEHNMDAISGYLKSPNKE